LVTALDAPAKSVAPHIKNDATKLCVKLLMVRMVARRVGMTIKPDKDNGNGGGLAGSKAFLQRHLALPIFRDGTILSPSLICFRESAYGPGGRIH